MKKEKQYLYFVSYNGNSKEKYQTIRGCTEIRMNHEIKCFDDIQNITNVLLQNTENLKDVTIDNYILMDVIEVSKKGE